MIDSLLSPLSDTVEARKKFLVIDEISRQSPFNIEPEAMNLDRLTGQLMGVSRLVD